MLSFTASVIETIIVKTTIFTAEQLFGIARAGTFYLYGLYYPSLTETEQLRHDIKLLQNELVEIKMKTCSIKDAENEEGWSVVAT